LETINSPFSVQSKKTISIKQTTYLGAELLTTAVPILNEHNEIELVVATSQELQTFKSIKKERESNPSVTNTSTPITNCTKMKDIIKVCEKIAKVDSPS
jgi:transcriptional regulator with PAS, ATPase and Fis domain